MENCIFCKIIKGQIPAAKMYEDDEIIIIKDIDPKAAKHYLMIPKKHYKLISEMQEGDDGILAKALKKIPALEKELGLEGGYRLIINQGENAGQTVFHLHVHILAGQPLAFPDLKIN